MLTLIITVKLIQEFLGVFLLDIILLEKVKNAMILSARMVVTSLDVTIFETTPYLQMLPLQGHNISETQYFNFVLSFTEIVKLLF